MGALECDHGADFYVIRLGIRRDLVTQNFQVFNASTFDVRSLNAGVPYVFIVDVVNERGITKGGGVIEIP